METPVVNAGGSKPDVQKPAREAGPRASQGHVTTRSEESVSDRAAISARSQAAATRAMARDATDADADGRPVRLGAGHSPPDGPAAADTLARETSRQIVGQPAAAARAQANSQAANVLSMLQ